MHGCQGVAPGTLLLIFCMDFLRWIGQNSPLSNELLQLTHNSDLEFLERLQLRKRTRDDNSFLTAANLNFLGGHEVQLEQLGLEVQVHLQFRESLGDARLQCIRLLAIGLHSPSLELNMAWTLAMLAAGTLLKMRFPSQTPRSC